MPASSPASGSTTRAATARCSPARAARSFTSPQGAGWQTAAVMPAITLAWPEAAWFGYDRILAAADLGYRGRPFNWVTMPDQFTLAAFERQLLDPRPVPRSSPRSRSSRRTRPGRRSRRSCPGTRSATAASSIAFAAAGDPPDVVWRDSDRVRDQYRLVARLRAAHRRRLRRAPRGATRADADRRPRRPSAGRLRLRRRREPRRADPRHRRRPTSSRASTPGVGPRA